MASPHWLEGRLLGKMGATLSQSTRNGSMTALLVFVLTTFVIYMCTREAYRQLDVGHEMDAVLSMDNIDALEDTCTLTSGPAHTALSALTGDDVRLWCDAKDGSCVLWTRGKVVDARCALARRVQQQPALS
jgi:hypothetical protein